MSKFIGINWIKKVNIKETTMITALIEDIMNVSLLIKEHPQHYLNITKINIYKTEKLIKQT